MTPIYQTILDHNPEQGIYGNCLQACVASLLDLSLDQVPHFALFGDEWRLKFLDFVYEQGYIYEGFAPTDELGNLKHNQGVNGYLMVSGVSLQGHNHVVIYKGGIIVHDPHPVRGKGLIEVKGFHMIRKGNGKSILNPWRLFL